MEASRIEEIIKRQKFPPGILHKFGMEFGEDQTGYPSAVISFTVQKDREPSKAYVDQLNSFARTVSAAILDADDSRWPYIRFVTEV